MGARKAVGLGLVVLAAMAALGAVLMLLWNALVPGLFGLRPVGYWQALGLLVLVRLLFGGGHPRQARAWDWRRRMVQRWEAMTPEERERFRRGLHGRFCRLDEPEPPAGGGRDQ
jgi:hypothetical protein